MSNTLTDQLHVVSVSTVQIGFPQILWGAAIRYNDGFSRELFRDKRHLGSIRSDDDVKQAHKGDTILAINMGPITLSFDGSLHTRDGYTCTYTAEVIVRVLDPTAFAICYNQGSDPLGQVRAAIHAALVKRIERQAHDDVTAEDLRFTVENGLSDAVPADSTVYGRQIRLLPSVGVAIVEAQKVIPIADTKRAAEIEEEHRVRLERARTEAEKKLALARQQADSEVQLDKLALDAELAKRQQIIQAEYDQAKVEADRTLAAMRRVLELRQLDESLDDEAKRREFDRDQRAQDALTQAATEQRIKVSTARFEANLKLIERLKANGTPEADIIQTYPELLPMLGGSPNVVGLLPSAAVVVASAPVNGEHGDTGEGTESGPQGFARFGVVVAKAELDDEQKAWSQAENGCAILVADLDASRAREHPFKLGDLILQINDEWVPPFHQVAELMERLLRDGQSVNVMVLRGEATKSLSISVPPANQGD